MRGRSRELTASNQSAKAALAIEGAEVTDYMAACHLLDQALDEYGTAVETDLTPPIH